MVLGQKHGKKILWIVLIIQILSVIGIVMLPAHRRNPDFYTELKGEGSAPLFQLQKTSDEENPEVYTEEIPLTAGEYIVTVHYSCSSSGNLISILSDTLDSENVGRTRWTILDPKTDSASVAFSLEQDVPDNKIVVVCKDKEGLEISSISVKNLNTAVPFRVQTAARIATWLFFCVLIDLFLYLYLNYPERRRSYTVLILITVVVSLRMIVPVHYLPFGDDLFFHINRIFGIRDGIARGVPWVKIQQNWYNGYGYAVGVYYGDTLLYLPAIFNLSGLHIHASYKLFIFLMHLLTAFSAYFCFRRMYGDNIGCVSSIVYSFLFFRWVDVYHRSAIGEFCAITFLPFLIYAVYLLWKDRYKESALMFVIGFSGVLHSHVLTCELAIFLVFLLLICSPKKTFQKKRILSLLVSAFWVVLVNLSYIVPFIDIAMSRSINAMKSTANKKYGFLHQISSARLNLLILIAFIPVLVSLLFAIVKVYKEKFLSSKEQTKQKEEKTSCFSIRVLLILTTVFLFMSSPVFPWKIIVNAGPIGALFVSLQFPWRFLTLAGILAAVIVCEILSGVDATEKAGQLIWMCLILFMVLPGFFYSFSGYEKVSAASFSTTGSTLLSRWNSQHEYLIEGTDVNDLSPEYHTSGDVKITAYEKDGTSVDFSYDTTSGGAIDLPVFNYPHYQASVENGGDLPISDGENHRIRIDLPSGTNGTVHVRFHTPILWILSLIVTLLAWGSLFGYWFYTRKIRFPKPKKNEISS